jgi:hypothetical protein
VAGPEKHLREVAGFVAGTVVGDDPLDPGDAVRGEKRSGPEHEPDRGDRFLVVEGFGVGQPGVAVDRGVQERIPGPAAFGRGPGGQVLSRTPAVDTPAAPIGDPPTFLMSTCTIWPGRRAMMRRGARFGSPFGSR